MIYSAWCQNSNSVRFCYRIYRTSIRRYSRNSSGSSSLKNRHVLLELSKLCTKHEGEITWEGILEYLELSPSDYLELGRIWREIGAYDEHASLRQQDQFIFLDDLPDFLNAVAGMFALGDTVTKDMIARMAIPVMEFTYGDKVHRSRVEHFAIFLILVFAVTSKILRILMEYIEKVCSLES